MNLSKREFFQVLGAGTMAGMGLGTYAEADAATAANGLYDIPKFGNVSLLHMTDCHAQLKPIYFREPSVNLGIGSMKGRLPHLVGEHLLKTAKLRPGSAEAYALTNLDFEKAARRYGKVDFVAQNIKTNDFGDPVFNPYSLREINCVPCAIIGQAFPYTPIANPRYMVADWAFGIQEETMQQVAQEVRAKGAQVVVLLSHNGMDVDLKMASRVSGIDAILGGHTHDGMPVASIVKNPGGQTIVTNAGSNGKFLGVIDFEVKDKKVADFRYKLLPIFANMLPADQEMDALITRVRAPYEAKLAEKLAVTEGSLYRRGNFNGTGDQLLLDALMDVQGADLAFSPGFRWGTSLLPGQPITREWLMDMTATTYSYTTLTEMTGATIKTVLEDVADNLFNPDPYYQQGGDMVRVGGLQYSCQPLAAMGGRIDDMRLNGKLIEADKKYKVAGWAPVSEEAKTAGGKPVWELTETWLKARGGKVSARKPNTPTLKGVLPNPGYLA